jgi:carbon storage regulator
MLVLSRKKGESVVTGPSLDNVVVMTVIDIRADKVRIGFEVPREWVLHRQEFHNPTRFDHPESPE